MWQFVEMLKIKAQSHTSYLATALLAMKVKVFIVAIKKNTMVFI